MNILVHCNISITHVQWAKDIIFHIAGVAGVSSVGNKITQEGSILRTTTVVSSWFMNSWWQLQFNITIQTLRMGFILGNVPHPLIINTRSASHQMPNSNRFQIGIVNLPLFFLSYILVCLGVRLHLTVRSGFHRSHGGNHLTDTTPAEVVPITKDITAWIIPLSSDCSCVE